MEFKNTKLMYTALIIVLGIASIFYANLKFSQFTYNEYAAVKDKKDTIILLDPGHGGIDGGATSKRGTSEKDINLKISLKAKDKLQKEGYKVIMTREEDKGLYTDNGTIRKKKIEDLSNRCKMKKDTNCDMFISVHLNMFPEAKYYGAQVWYSKNKDSEILARIVQTNLKSNLDPSNKREHKPAANSYKVLRSNDSMPSIIVECGFLSNGPEEEKLKLDSYQDRIAEALTKSVNQYYNNAK